jgi:hypothetical protein
MQSSRPLWERDRERGLGCEALSYKVPDGRQIHIKTQPPRLRQSYINKQYKLIHSYVTRIGKLIRVGTKYKLKKKEGESPPSRATSSPFFRERIKVRVAVVLLICVLKMRINRSPYPFCES